jgi:hypothetical protein
MNLMEVEAGRGNCDYDAVGELRELRAHFEVRVPSVFPDPGSECFLPGSLIRIKEFMYFNPKKMVSKLSEI